MKNYGFPKISVVITVLNEASTIQLLISSLLKQTFQNFELIIIDGGSDDNTFSLIPKLKNVQKYIVKGNRSVCRNYGVKKAKGKIIAFTDAGCIPEPNWIENLIKPFTQPDVQIVSGYYRGVYTNVFEKSLIPFVLTMPNQIDKSEFLPATRSMAIRKNVFLNVGGFDEMLSHNEDYAFAILLKNLGYKFTFAETAIVNWLPRKTLSQSAWMFMRFAIGDAQAGILRKQIRPLFLRFLFMLYLIFLVPYFPILIKPILLLILFYILISIKKNYQYVNHVAALFWLPIIQFTCDISILFGTLVGIMSKIWK